MFQSYSYNPPLQASTVEVDQADTTMELPIILLLIVWVPQCYYSIIYTKALLALFRPLSYLQSSARKLLQTGNLKVVGGFGPLWPPTTPEIETLAMEREQGRPQHVAENLVLTALSPYQP